MIIGRDGIAIPSFVEGHKTLPRSLKADQADTDEHFLVATGQSCSALGQRQQMPATLVCFGINEYGRRSVR